MHVRFACPRPRLFAALTISVLVVWLIVSAVVLCGFVTLVGALSACSTPEPTRTGAPSARRHEDPECRSTPPGTSTPRRLAPSRDPGLDAIEPRSTAPSEIGSGATARPARRR